MEPSWEMFARANSAPWEVLEHAANRFLDGVIHHVGVGKRPPDIELRPPTPDQDPGFGVSDIDKNRALVILDDL